MRPMLISTSTLLIWVFLHAAFRSGCVRAQVDGFISLACGSQFSSGYTDDNKIEWMADASIMQEGEAVRVGEHPYELQLSSMRVFAGNESKYCYSLSNSAVQSREFFLIRASFWAGTSPRYMPRSADGNYRFKLLIDADEWKDILVPYTGNSSWWSHEMYLRAQRSSIDVCLARSSPDGDAPFISTLELRPLPSTLTSARYMNATGFDALYLDGDRADYTTADYTFTRYPFDSFDRTWSSVVIPTENSIVTDESVDTTTSLNRPPMRILQSAFISEAGFTLTLSGKEAGRTYVVVFYFAEIDPNVTAKGQRSFNIDVNGELYTTEGPIDVFDDAGGAFDATTYTFFGMPSPTDGEFLFNFTSSNTSLLPPFLAAAEFFILKNTSSSALSFPDDVNVIEEIKTSMNLTQYTGDPCLPKDYKYPWVECIETTIPSTRVTRISLSNYGAAGLIPKSLNSLTFLTILSLDGNKLQGIIPDLSSLQRLEILNLSNNNLNGPIPQYLTMLKNLKELYVHNNNLSGEIPSILLEKKKELTLKFEFYGNILLCDANKEVICNETSPTITPRSTPSTNSKTNIALVVGVTISGIFVLAILFGICLFFSCKRTITPKKKEPTSDPQQVELPSKQSSDSVTHSHR